MITPRQAVAALNRLDGSEPESQHKEADEILLDALPPAVRRTMQMVGLLMRALDEVANEAVSWIYALRNQGIDIAESAGRKALHECQEFVDNPCLEAADVFIALIAACNGQGWTPEQLADAASAKMVVNRGSTWEKLADGTWQHVKSVACYLCRKPCTGTRRDVLGEHRLGGNLPVCDDCGSYLDAEPFDHEDWR